MVSVASCMLMVVRIDAFQVYMPFYPASPSIFFSDTGPHTADDPLLSFTLSS
jgi:hypothetical protein